MVGYRPPRQVGLWQYISRVRACRVLGVSALPCWPQGMAAPGGGTQEVELAYPMLLLGGCWAVGNAGTLLWGWESAGPSGFHDLNIQVQLEATEELRMKCPLPSPEGYSPGPG